MKIRIDQTIISTIFILIAIKLTFSYLNVELDWWQRHLTPNFEKFNFLSLPEGFTRTLEYLIIPLMILYTIKNWRYLGNLVVPYMIILTMVFLNIVTFFINDVKLVRSLEYTIKLSAPILFFMCLFVHNKKYNFNLEKIMFRILWFCVFLVIVGILFFDESYNHWRNWLPIFFSSLHTHSYILACIGIGFSYRLYRQKKYAYLYMFLLAWLLFMYFGYRIRSAIVFFLIYTIVITYLTHNIFKALWIKLIINIPLVLLVFFLVSDKSDLNQLSAGRISMYQTKIEMLKDYNLIEYSFGRGRGSDFVRTDQWWYAEKNSHNDYLTFLVENGLPYTLLFILLLISMVVFTGRVNLIVAGILLGYMFVSLLSNGLPTRPMVGYILFTILACIYIDGKNTYKIRVVDNRAE